MAVMLSPRTRTPSTIALRYSDNDGTLWTEQPVYVQLVFALDRAAELGQPASLEELGSGTEQLLAAATEHKWTVIDMATDWATIHPDT